ncbi:MAG: 4-hydroxy-3-methylbut-2-enyl diphosphate reductase [Akkermansiaceae bacterium]|nr:4-hydroxy-3-methylbut-2-enyl diphosphate reductase [Akkermansiaceae bacterium]NNM30685.1 4-hydroxy-3-methylbut-2-enyl diphosphate reductase [Akkermansiaceae bacterium]
MTRFEIKLAEHYGMCFGVRDALAAAEGVARERPATILGQLVHNEVVRERLAAMGVQDGELAASRAPTADVIVTAHGASDRDRTRWASGGYAVTDTTCPLVRKAHGALAQLVAAGCAPVVIGKAGHVEVRGLTGDFPGAQVVLSDEDVAALPFAEKIGVVAQTTQPIERVGHLVEAIRRRHPSAEVIFKDTVCQPTKARQTALRDLCREVEFVLVVGGANSNNSWELVEKARRLGCRAERAARPEEVKEHWLYGCGTVGVTAGTSTLRDTVAEVVRRLEELGGVRIPDTGGGRPAKGEWERVA